MSASSTVLYWRPLEARFSQRSGAFTNERETAAAKLGTVTKDASNAVPAVVCYLKS